MKSKFLQQIKFIDDGSTTGISRKGFNSALIIVNGGTDTKDIDLYTGTVAGTTSKLRTIGTSTGAGTTVAIQTTLEDCKEYIKVAGTSLTSVQIVLGDGDIDPADSSSVIR